MKINEVKSNIVFKSGYPTFKTGHLGYDPNSEIYSLIYMGFNPARPSGILKSGNKLDIKA